MSSIVGDLMYGFSTLLANLVSVITETGDAVRDFFAVFVNFARHELQELEKVILFGEFIEGDPPESIMMGLHI